jgi:hypothetical protein
MKKIQKMLKSMDYTNVLKNLEQEFNPFLLTFRRFANYTKREQ